MKKILIFVSGIFFSIILFLFFGTGIISLVENAFLGLLLMVLNVYVSIKFGFKLSNKIIKGNDKEGSITKEQNTIYEKKIEKQNIKKSIIDEQIPSEPKFISLSNYAKKDFVTKHKDYKLQGNEFIALDLETTGLSTNYDRVVEIAAIKFSNNEKVETFHTLIDPRRNIPTSSTNIHGITDDMVKNSPTIYDVIPILLDFFDDFPIVAHNIMFDIGFIKNACIRHFRDEDFWLENRLIDTVKLSREMFPQLPNHKLDTVMEHLNTKIENRHRAAGDAYVAGQIYIEYLSYMEKKKEERYQGLSDEEKKVYEIVKSMIADNDRTTKYLNFRRVGRYFDVETFYQFVRVKLSGRKYYLVSDLTIDELQSYNIQLQLEECPKSETGKTRILIEEPEDLRQLEPLILDSFDKAMESLKIYRENVKSSENNIQKYLSEI